MELISIDLVFILVSVKIHLLLFICFNFLFVLTATFQYCMSHNHIWASYMNSKTPWLFSPLLWKTQNFCLGGIWPDWCLLNISPATIDETTLTLVLPLTMTWYNKVADWIFQPLFQHIFIWNYRMQLFNSVHSKLWNIFMFKTNFVYCHSCHLYWANFHLFVCLFIYFSVEQNITESIRKDVPFWEQATDFLYINIWGDTDNY